MWNTLGRFDGEGNAIGTTTVWNGEFPKNIYSRRGVNPSVLGTRTLPHLNTATISFSTVPLRKIPGSKVFGSNFHLCHSAACNRQTLSIVPGSIFRLIKINWLSEKAAEQPKTNNLFQRQCEKGNRCRVYLWRR